MQKIYYKKATYLLYVFMVDLWWKSGRGSDSDTVSRRRRRSSS